MNRILTLALLIAAAGFLSVATGCNTPTVAKGDSGCSARLVSIHPTTEVITAAPITETPLDIK